MAYETALQERLRHDAEKASDNLSRQAREAAWRGADVSPGVALEQFKVVKLPLNFDTPDLLWDEETETGGITLYTPVEGDFLVKASLITPETDWDAAGTKAWIYLSGANYLGGELLLGPVWLTNTWGASSAGEGALSPNGDSYRLGDSFDTPNPSMEAGVYLTGEHTIDVVVRRSDGGSVKEDVSQGASKVVLVIIKAS